MFELYEYKALVLKVVDADTIDIEIDLGFGVTKTERVRLAGINAYETTRRGGTTAAEKKLGIEAKEYVTQLILGKTIYVKTEQDKKGKFGRYIADIWFEEVHINKDLVKKGYAVEVQY